MMIPAMQVKGPGEVEVVGGVVKFYEGDKVIARLTGTMGKVCSSIEFNPLIGLACGLTRLPYKYIDPLPELRNHQSFLVGAMRHDSSNKLVNMPRTSCSGDDGVTLEMSE